MKKAVFVTLLFCGLAFMPIQADAVTPLNDPSMEIALMDDDGECTATVIKDGVTYSVTANSCRKARKEVVKLYKEINE